MAFDIFGHTEERKAERALIEEYVELASEFVQTLTSANLPPAIRLAAIPEEIRGFAHVKERNMKAAARKRVRLLVQYRAVAAQDIAA